MRPPLLVVVLCVLGALTALLELPARPKPLLPSPVVPIDESNIAVGPYRFDISGLVGWPDRNPESVTLEVIVLAGKGYFKHDSEGLAPNGATVVPLYIRYKPTRGGRFSVPPRDGRMVDGFRMTEASKGKIMLHVLNTKDAIGNPIIYCSFSIVEADLIRRESSLDNTKYGQCRLFFRPRVDLVASMPVPPLVLRHMEVLVPQIYEMTLRLIKGP